MDAPGSQRRSSAWTSDVLRAAGGAIGVFILINLAGEVIRPPFSTLSDWLTVPGPRWLAHLAGIAVAVALIAHAVAPIPRRAGRAIAALLAAGAVCALLDTMRFYAALRAGYFRTPAVVPASILVAAILVAFAVSVFRDRGARPPWTRRRVMIALGTAVGVAFAIPLVRMVSFGPSRYDRRAEYAVVFGARVWDNGTPSHALADRVDEAIRLYQRGLVHKILMSGAVDAHNGFSEPEVMKSRAVVAGVPAEDVVLDEQGVDTASTVRNTARILGRSPEEAALVVTHYYHEPRAKMLFDRAGVRVYTVPARMSHRLLKEPYFIVREVAAYYHSFLLE